MRHHGSPRTCLRCKNLSRYIVTYQDVDWKGVVLTLGYSDFDDSELNNVLLCPRS